MASIRCYDNSDVIVILTNFHIYLIHLYVEVIFPKYLLIATSCWCSNLGGIDPKKNYRATILEQKFFQSSLNGKHYLQAHGGTAMSTKTAVSFAKISRETQSLVRFNEKAIINVKTHFKQTENCRHPLSVKYNF